MPPEDLTQPGVSTSDDDGQQDPPAAPPPPESLAPEAVRKTPEYKVLERQNRELARQAGAAKREAEQARAAAEQARIAAEATRQADLEAELEGILGEDGVEVFNEISELSQTDPTAAARRIAELVAQSRAQSAGPQSPAPGAAAPPEEGTVPPATPATPPPPRGVGADVPLGAPPTTQQENWDEIANGLEARFNTTVERVQDPQTRNRTSFRERADAMLAYVGSALIRGGARPSK